MAYLCTLMGIRHSPRTFYSPWTNGLVEVQNKNLGTHIRMFFTKHSQGLGTSSLYVNKYQKSDNLDSSSDTPLSAPSSTSSTSQTVLTTHSRNVLIPPTRPISTIFDTSSTKSYSTSSNTIRPPISEISITPPSQSHSSPIHTHLFIYQIPSLFKIH